MGAEHTCVHVYVPGEHRGQQPQVLCLRLLPTCLVEIGSLPGLEFTMYGRLVGQRAQGSTHLSQPSCGITSMHCHTQHFYLVLGTEPGSLFAWQALYPSSHLPGLSYPFFSQQTGFCVACLCDSIPNVSHTLESFLSLLCNIDMVSWSHLLQGCS